MKEKVISILKGIRADVDYENNTTLIDDGELTSLDVLQIIAEFGDEFDVMIRPSEIKPKNFNSVEAMVALIERLMEG